MTPSIIRRFARYHHLDAMFDAPIGDSAATIERLCVLYFGSGDTLDVIRLVQALTRIEDAEHCLFRSTVRYFNRTDAERGEAATIADELFALAGVDPAKWRGVKDE